MMLAESVLIRMRHALIDQCHSDCNLVQHLGGRCCSDCARVDIGCGFVNTGTEGGKQTMTLSVNMIGGRE